MKTISLTSGNFQCLTLDGTERTVLGHDTNPAITAMCKNAYRNSSHGTDTAGFAGTSGQTYSISFKAEQTWKFTITFICKAGLRPIGILVHKHILILSYSI